jgi:Outer membrane protein beta-barrel domain
METKTVKAFWTSVLLGVSLPALAQYVSTPPPNESPPPAQLSQAGVGELHVDPKNGQNQEQQWHDRYECHRWAKGQSGYDPTQQAAGASQNTAGADGYRRAMTACLEARGYAVRYGTTYKAAPPPPAPPPAPVHAKSWPELQYHPITAHIDGGYTATVGTTDHLLEGGGNVGFGLTWYPSSALPIGLRVDGSYTRLRARDAFLNWYGGNFTSGHDNIYGGDVDLQLDLAHTSPYVKMYLLGGYGWYREQAYLRQVTWYPGEICGWYFCEDGYFPVVTGVQRTTSPWHNSWNAGLGIEVAAGEGTSFFVEARYQRISADYNGKLQFVPIRFGLRF